MGRELRSILGNKMSGVTKKKSNTMKFIMNIPILKVYLEGGGLINKDTYRMIHDDNE